jgi:hypothetical protein
MRKEFKLTNAQEKALLKACHPTPVMYLTGGKLMGPTQQENANDAWCKLGKELGFDGMSVKPVDGKCNAHFTAEVVEDV